MFPSWLSMLCNVSLWLGFACALIVLIDVLLHPPQMPIMGIVWPVCALFGTLLLLWLYFRHGREAGKRLDHHRHQAGYCLISRRSSAFPIVVAQALCIAVVAVRSATSLRNGLALLFQA